jgi:peptidoglycan/LPS O-acetylase OafA/YrhL
VLLYSLVGEVEDEIDFWGTLGCLVLILGGLTAGAYRVARRTHFGPALLAACLVAALLHVLHALATRNGLEGLPFLILLIVVPCAIAAAMGARSND